MTEIMTAPHALTEVFGDHLQLVRDGERFRVVAKTWHLERVVD